MLAGHEKVDQCAERVLLPECTRMRRRPSRGRRLRVFRLEEVPDASSPRAPEFVIDAGNSRQSEIDDLHPAGVVYQKIPGMDIGMDHTAFMKLRVRIKDCPAKPEQTPRPLYH